MSDGSDFVIGTDVERTKSGGDATETCIEFKGTWQERKQYQLHLQDELKSWDETKCIETITWDVEQIMTEFEKRAVLTISESPKLFSEFNRQTRELGPNNPNYEFKAMYFFLCMAINKLSPQHLGIQPYRVYRGVTYDVTDAFVGQSFHFTNFVFTSTDPSVIENFLDSVSGWRTLFIIDTYKGVKIPKSLCNPFEEVVIPGPRNYYKVVLNDEKAIQKRRKIHLISLLK